MDFTQSKEGAFLVLAVAGRMDTITAPQFEAQCLACLEAGDKRLVVDLGGLEYISSAGLRSILSAAKKLKAAGGDIAFCALSGIVAEVFAVSGFNKLMPVFATRQEALARA
ncbi:MAG TPA: STAS domain-containing protein [Humidesulfovibrio sp.]|uniref:STAS domain-containing protein n=1 Tax=Humidesulfovibrio sp. TaxID=2910988 RepID=UPI002CE2BF28|nr:STAS domain-containing protein [Humidesulfovibrio sp.]HWR03688.1 STAS domain-containing protein [Humidesulfovibrio sp.]